MPHGELHEIVAFLSEPSLRPNLNAWSQSVPPVKLFRPFAAAYQFLPFGVFHVPIRKKTGSIIQ